MAGKETKSNTSAKSTAQSKTATTTKTTAKAMTKPSAKPAPTAKSAGNQKPATSAKSATTKSAGSAKSATTAKAKTNAKPVAKTKAETPVKANAEQKSVKTKTEKTTTSKTATTTETKTTTAKSASKSVAKPTASKSETKTETKPTATKSAKTNKPSGKTSSPKKQSAMTKAVASGENKGRGTTAKSGGAKAIKARNVRLICIIVLSLVMVLSLILGLVLGLKSCNPAYDPFDDFGVYTMTSYENAHKNVTQVGYYGEITGSVDRYKPVSGVHNEGMSSKGYPTYGSTLDLATAEKTTVIQESRKLTANGTWVDSSMRTSGTYDMMDKDGYLYKKDGSKPDEGVPERLYKHTASVGMYGGDVAGDEPAVVKTLTFRKRSYSDYYSVTGLYAPAGEVIKIQMTGADMNATGGITIHIGQALYNGQANNIWEQRNVNRMPIILNTMSITKETATYDEETDLWTGYVGSFLGGPIYVRDEASTFSVTISGGVNYAHFILGVTTEEEYNIYLKSSAPYFDLEVWDNGVLHSGPRRRAERFSYNELYKAAILWEKIALVTTSSSVQGIVFLYDPFVAAGAAVAFPGRRSVNCPEDWMTESLNYEGFVTSGAWGNMHEYHHNFQNYGLSTGADGEVTNNGLNLVSYSLFTKISSARQMAGFGGAGLSGWNQYTSATWALNQVNNKDILSTNGLAVYATLLHNFGQDAYLKARTNWGVAYFNKFAEITHNDFSYYATSVQNYSNVSPSALKKTNYPLFVPVSSVYQTGRTYNYDGEKREIITMQPYVIPYGQSFRVDLSKYTVNSANQYVSGSVVIGNGFNYSIKSVSTDGVNGTFVKESDYIYTFNPNQELRSGKIRVTLEITPTSDDWKGYTVDDVDLILEFQQSHESNKGILERTIYNYTADTAYVSATQAYENGYSGYTSVETKNNKNYSQNSNTDIWIYHPTSDAEQFGEYMYPLNSVMEIRGKLYFPEAGRYRIYMRGRKDCALYISRDGGKTYSLSAHIDRNDGLGTGSGFYPNNDKTYCDVDVEAGDWVYFKEVLIVETVGSNIMSFVGLGMSAWTVPMYTAEVRYYTVVNSVKTVLTQETVDGETKYYYNKNGEKVYPDSKDVKTETVYKNSSGVEVSAEEAANTNLIPPTATPTYVTAYRQTYEFQRQFESEYFYKKSYTYTYSNVAKPSADACILEAKNVETWDNTPVEGLLQEDGKFQAKSWNSPIEITVDLGHEVTANRLDLYGTLYNGNSYHPRKFYVLVGTSPDDITTPFGPLWENVNSSNGNVGFVTDEPLTFRYYKIVIIEWSFGAPQFSYVKFSYVLLGTANMYTLGNEMFAYKGDWRIAQANSSFGHVYLGRKGDEVSFEFDATSDSSRLGILTSSKFGQNYEVYIDGVKVASEELPEDSNEATLRYLSQTLSKGKHTVTIKCTGEANFDSIVIYP